MSEEKTYSESEAQRLFAVRFHGKVWELLEKPDRTKQEDELMGFCLRVCGPSERRGGQSR